MCNLWTRKGFETKTGDQVDDVTSRSHLSIDNPSVCFNLIPSHEVENREGADFFHVGLGQ